MPAPIVIADSITRVGPDAAGAVVVNASHGGVYAAYLAAKLARCRGDIQRCRRRSRPRRDRRPRLPARIRHRRRDRRPRHGADRRRRRHDGARRHHPCERAGRVAWGQTRPIVPRCRRRAATRHARRIARRRKRWRGRSCLSRQRRRSGRSTRPRSCCPSTRTRSSSPARMAGCSAASRRPRSNTTCSARFTTTPGSARTTPASRACRRSTARGIAAATVSAASARIGDARSTYEDGIVSRVNTRAAALGLREGISARDFVARLRSRPYRLRRSYD